MTRARTWLVYGVLLAAAAGLGLANQGASPTSRIPSVDNPDGAGLKALFLLLRERGFDARRLEGNLVAVPADLRTLVIAAPAEREIDREEVAALRHFVGGGGRLVYLAPRPFDHAQPAMARWLQLLPSGALRPDEVTSRMGDLSGAQATVWAPPRGAADVRRLRVAAGGGIASGAATAIPAAGGPGEAAALTWTWGQGEIWAFAGASVAENRRLEKEDNLALWLAFAAEGPVGFDEHHHLRAETAALPPAFLAIAAQLLLAALACALARGTRLGPPRPEPAQRHRSILEYVRSMAWLTRRARVEPALALALATRLRQAMRDRAGVPVTVPDAEAALQLELGMKLPRERTAATLAALREAAATPGLRPQRYLRCARLAAELERALSGRTS